MQGGVAAGSAPARVALSLESRAPHNACIIIMTDADRAAASLISVPFDLAAAKPVRSNEPPAYLYSVRRRVASGLALRPRSK